MAEQNPQSGVGQAPQQVYTDPTTNQLYTVNPTTGESEWVVDPDTGQTQTADNQGNTPAAAQPAAQNNTQTTQGASFNPPSETTVVVQQDKGLPTSGLAVASLVLGIIGFLISFLPLANLGSIIMGLLGLVLGIVGLVGINKGRNRGKGTAIAGIVLSALALFITFFMYGSAATIASNTKSDAPTDSTASTSVSATAESTEQQDSSADTEASTPEPAPEPEAPTLGSTFEFDDLSITVGDTVNMTTLQNQFSDHDGQTVLQLPVSVTNNSDETKGLNMFYLKEFGAQGTELDSIFTYFDDDARMAGDIRPGATLSSNLYFLADGSGDYYLNFKNFTDSIDVKIPVTLP